MVQPSADVRKQFSLLTSQFTSYFVVSGHHLLEKPIGLSSVIFQSLLFHTICDPRHIQGSHDI
jgi:hypothetical protein